MTDEENNSELPGLKERVSKVQLFLIGAALIGGLVVLGFQQRMLGQKPTVEILGTSGGNDSLEAITVDVAGAVVRPGVVRLPSGSRVADALEAVGGLSQEADQERVGKVINLATKLIDGGKLYIPKIGEAASGLSPLPPEAPSHTVNINAASQAELEALPGIGPVTARKIINDRPYATVDELLTKRVVTKRVFEGIKNQVSAY